MKKLIEPIKNILDTLSIQYQPILVGGCVRDFLLGENPKDIDIEVHGCSIDELQSILSSFGKVDAVGKSFGILKFNNEYDFSVPRKETKTGTGHKGFDVSFENVSLIDAFRRRDFTINAIGWDYKTEKYIDFFHGISDLNNKIIRHIDDNTFIEDALRIYRAMQFQCRFGFNIANETLKLIHDMVVYDGCLDELPIERIADEWKKWAVKGKYHSMIFGFLKITGIGIRYFTDLLRLRNTLQDSIFHPEGDVEYHTQLVLQEALQIAMRENLNDDEKEVLIYSALLHDIGKPDTTQKRYENEILRISSHNHEAEGVPLANKFLKTIGVRQDLIKRILKCVELHMYPIGWKNLLLHKNIKNINSTKHKFVLKLKRIVEPSTIDELVRLIEADSSGRHPLPKGLPDFVKDMYDFSKEVKLNTVEKFKNIINGHHLIKLGLKPSSLFKVILEDCVQAQIDGIITDEESGVEYVKLNLFRF